MSPQAQRIAIAEACGWKMITIKDCGPYPHGIDPNGDRMHTAILPYYLNDLNAMHEAEKTLGVRSATYANVLEEVCRRDRGDLVSDGQKWHATAAQRAEAFLRTFDKWEESAA